MGYVAQTAGLGPASLKAKEQQIVYQKLGRIIAIDNGGNILGTKKYCNDRTDPTRAAETFYPISRVIIVRSKLKRSYRVIRVVIFLLNI